MLLLRPTGIRAAATLLRRPYLQDARSDRVSILWTTLEAGAGQVVVAAPGGDTFTVAATTRVLAPALTKLSYPYYQYQANITGLQPGTEYAYRITWNGATLTPTPGFFRTAGPGGFSFLVFGDSGQNTPGQRNVVQLMAAETGVSFLTHTGDLTYPDGGFGLYETNYFGMNAGLFGRLPVFPTPGNHDYAADSAAAFLADHVLPVSGVDPADAGRYYSFDWGDAHFTSIDSNLMATDRADAMLAWLANDLASTRQFWKIVFLHHPPYPTGHHLGDPICGVMRARVNPILEQHGAQLVVGGHEHGYERTAALAADARVDPGYGTTYAITGGGGADLHDVNCGTLTDVAVESYHYVRVDVDGGTLTMRAIDVGGNELDRYVLRPKPVISERGVVSMGDYTQPIAAGSLVSVFGKNLGLRPQTVSDATWPSQLGGVRVQLNGADLPEVFASPGQVNLQIPFDAPAEGTLQVVTDNGTAQTKISLSPTAPSILVVMTLDTAVSDRNPLSASSPVVIYATGLGPCESGATAGSLVPAASPAIAAVEVWLGDLLVQPSFAGLTPRWPGVYAVNFTVPPDVPPGTYSLRIAAGGASSRSVAVTVR